MSNYTTGREAAKILGVHQRTLYQWDAKGKIKTIRTPGNKRMYDVDGFLKERGVETAIPVVPIVSSNCPLTSSNHLLTPSKQTEPVKNNSNGSKLNLSYIRVSSNSQKDDLERQRAFMLEKYPDHLLIEDIGSGVNFNKRGLRKIINLAIAGQVNELVIAYKDRLVRFGYDLVEDLIKEYSGGKIIIINQREDLEPEEELAGDVLQIMNVFVAKMNGLRKYRKKIENTNEEV